MYVYTVLSGCWSALSCRSERSITGIALYSPFGFLAFLYVFADPCRPLSNRTSGSSPPLTKCRSELTSHLTITQFCFHQHVTAQLRSPLD